MRLLRVLLFTAIFLSMFLMPTPLPVRAATLPNGFQESVVFSGLTNPSNIRFSPDGRVFVAEKSGLIKVFDSLTDATPTVFADLRTKTHNFWDRGMLGLALDPNFPTDPYVYVLYTHDAAIGATAPRWGSVGGTSDGCPSPPGATTDGCLVSGRLSRLQADGNVMTGTEQVLIEAWCQQFPSHSIGDLVFGEDGALYVSAGDGANFNNLDYGQYGGTNSGAGYQTNPCADPPGGVGGSMTSPTAEGGALRSQSLQRSSGEPIVLNGTILRVDPDTGLALADNPLINHTSNDAQRIVAYGLRNPFRMAARPGTKELWIGDVGWNTREEVNRISDPTDSAIDNFGWPCYEGNNRQSGYDNTNLDICENLYTEGSTAVTAPYYSYKHTDHVVSTESCPTGSTSISGLAFQSGDSSPYPITYKDALFFADYSRDCIWVMFKGTNGLPDPTNIQTFVDGASNPVDIELGPDGYLYYADFDNGMIRRIEYFGQNQPPSATVTANPTNGVAPLEVNFDGSTSSDPDADNTITFAWDLDGDGAYDDSTLAQPSNIYPQGTYQVRLLVTDNHGAYTISDPITISSGNTPPTPVIDTPAIGTTWQVGDTINFSGSAGDSEDGSLPASAFSWTLIMHHCPSNCHSHPIQSFSGLTSGSFSAPDHEYPSYMELQLTVTDSGGLTGTTSIDINPQTVALTFQTSPTGLQVGFNATTQTTPFTATVIVGSSNTVSASSTQDVGGSSYAFQSWSNSGVQTYTLIAPASSTTYTANYAEIAVHTASPTPTLTTTPTPAATKKADQTPLPGQQARQSLAILPIYLTTQSGDVSGSISNLNLIDQTGADDDPAAYLQFETLDNVYMGYQSYLLPANSQAEKISSILLQVNFKRLSSSQIWIWSAYDWTTGNWVKIGDTLGSQSNAWSTYHFPIYSVARFISPTREIRIRLQSSDPTEDIKIDYEAIHITYEPLEPTPTSVITTPLPTKPKYTFPATFTPTAMP